MSEPLSITTSASRERSAAAPGDHARPAPTASDPAAFAPVYLANYRAVAGAIYRRTGDPNLTEDLTADVFLAAFKSFHRYRPTEVPVRVWLLRIATNRVNRWARRRGGLAAILRRLARIRPAEDSPPATREYPTALSALLSLPPDHQSVLSLHHLEGLAVEEVSLVLEIPVGTVKSRLARARDSLRRRLLAQGEHP